MRYMILVAIACVLSFSACSDHEARASKAKQVANEFYVAIKEGRFLDARAMFEESYWTRTAEPIRSEAGWLEFWKEGVAKGVTKFDYDLEVEKENRNNVPLTVNATLTFDPSTPWGAAQKAGDLGDGFSGPTGKMQFIIGEVKGKWVIKNYEIKRDYSGYSR